MRIVFDQGTPVPLRQHLTAHQVLTTFELGWSKLDNGELLAAAVREGFNMLITTDQNLKHQQDLSAREISIMVLSTTSWPRIREVVADITAAVDSINAGDYREVVVP